MATPTSRSRHAFAIACLVLTAACSTEDPCELASVSHDWTAAVAACEASYRSTGEPEAGIRQAWAAFYLGRPDVAIEVATGLLATEQRFDAHGLLGAIAVARGDSARAKQHLVLAEPGHLRAGNLPAAARDALQMAGAYRDEGAFQSALDTMDRAGRYAIFDRTMDSALALGRANLLRILGHRTEAERTLDVAMQAVADPADRIRIGLAQGILYLDDREMALARTKLAETLAAERAQPNPRESIVQAALLNLAFIDRETGNFKQAADELEATLATHVDPMSYRLNRGRVRADEGRLADAEADFAAAEAESPSGSWWWVVPYYRGNVAARSGRRADAESFYRTAIERLTTLATRVGPVGASLVANNREPFESLIGIVARQQRWNDVLEVVAAMDSADMLTAPSDPQRPTPPDVPLDTAPVQPRALLHVAAAEITTAWTGTRLEIVVGDGDDSVWRIDVDHGRMTGSRVGTVARLTELAHHLGTNMDDRAVASELGAAFLPAGLDPGEPVAVLAIGPLAEAPIPLLRIGDELAIAHLSIARATRVTPGTAHAFTAATAVLGDARGDLPHARDEAQAIANELGATVAVGPSATRAALIAAAGGELLHVAAHATSGGLQLADGVVNAEDIARLRSPRVVVLAACSSGEGVEAMGTGSLADAFLSAGAQVVIATTRPVDDGLAQRVVAAFYAHDGAHHPAAALAAAQQQLVSMPAAAWAAFEVRLGRPSR